MRNLLHKAKLEAFRQWLTVKGVQHRTGRGAFQVLQVLVRGNWLCIYDRIEAPEHYTNDERLIGTLRKFINDSRN